MSDIICISDEDSVDNRLISNLADNQELVEVNNVQQSPACSTSLRDDDPSSGSSMWYRGAEADGFYVNAGDSYVYPTNYPVRKYQENIVATALFHNTLVSLPTGLGKTFIAAVVMYNFYRWYPNGKVVFMAPTKPLVAQQVTACRSVMNIPVSDIVELTGTTGSNEREQLWRSKRVFFATPQVVSNDLKSGICPYREIRCVVVDEAHRAVNEYAYCHIVRFLRDKNAIYRMLALSATPGSDIPSVREMIKELGISMMEARGENSLDVKPHLHRRQINPDIVELTRDILETKDMFLKVYEKYSHRLRERKLFPSNIATTSKFQVLTLSNNFTRNPPRDMSVSMQGSLKSDFSICINMASALDLLQTYGLRAFTQSLKDDYGTKNKAASSRLSKDVELQQILNGLDQKLSVKPDEPNYVWGHPKMKRLVKLLMEHFAQGQSNAENNSKAIVFCMFRVVVSEVFELLNTTSAREAGIRPATFIGQAAGAAGPGGMNQQTQIKTMKEFRAGVNNVLIATCVAEEGLDIGEVELIVMMEAPGGGRSPGRMIQRAGRTARSRPGRVIALVTAGREKKKFDDIMSATKNYVETVVNSKAVKDSLLKFSPTMLPPGVKPERLYLHMQKNQDVETAKEDEEMDKKKGSRRSGGTSDIRTHLVAEPDAMLSVEEINKIAKELNMEKLNFNQIPKCSAIFHRIKGSLMDVDELVSKSPLSSWMEWSKSLSSSDLISNSSDSRMLVNLLNREKPHTPKEKKEPRIILTKWKRDNVGDLKQTAKASSKSDPLVDDLIRCMDDALATIGAAKEAAEIADICTSLARFALLPPTVPTSNYLPFNQAWDNLAVEVQSSFENEFGSVPPVSRTSINRLVALRHRREASNGSEFDDTIACVDELFGDSQEFPQDLPFSPIKANCAKPSEGFQVSKAAPGFIPVAKNFSFVSPSKGHVSDNQPNLPQSADQVPGFIARRESAAVFEDDDSLASLDEILMQVESEHFGKISNRDALPVVQDNEVTASNDSLARIFGDSGGFSDLVVSSEKSKISSNNRVVPSTEKGDAISSESATPVKSLPNSVASSTPFTKTVVSKEIKLVSDLSPIKENEVVSAQLNQSTDDDMDDWDIGDILARDDATIKERSDKTMNTSTLYDITQLVDLIEEDKKKKKLENNAPKDNNSRQTTITDLLDEDDDDVFLPIESSKINTQRASDLKQSKVQDDSKNLLDEDDDLFSNLDQLLGVVEEKAQQKMSPKASMFTFHSNKAMEEISRQNAGKPYSPLGKKAMSLECLKPREKNCSKEACRTSNFISSKSVDTQPSKPQDVTSNILSSKEFASEPYSLNQTNLPSTSRSTNFKGFKSFKKKLAFSRPAEVVDLTPVPASCEKVYKRYDPSMCWNFEDDGVIQRNNSQGTSRSIYHDATIVSYSEPVSGSSTSYVRQKERLTFKEKPLSKVVKKLALSDAENELDDSVFVSSQRSVKPLKKKRRKKSRRLETSLLNLEAEVSGVVSEDEEDPDSSIDSQSSFIDDATEHVDHHMYLKTLRSPCGRPGGFKIPAHPAKRKPNYSILDDTINHSQVQSQYVNDSFCVGSDESLESDESSSSDNTSRLESPRNSSICTTPGNKTAAQGSSPEVFVVRRQQQVVSSQESPQATVKRKRHLISSDEEVTPPRKANVKKFVKNTNRFNTNR